MNLITSSIWKTMISDIMPSWKETILYNTTYQLTVNLIYKALIIREKIIDMFRESGIKVIGLLLWQQSPLVRKICLIRNRNNFIGPE